MNLEFIRFGHKVKRKNMKCSSWFSKIQIKYEIKFSTHFFSQTICSFILFLPWNESFSSRNYCLAGLTKSNSISQSWYWEEARRRKFFGQFLIVSSFNPKTPFAVQKLSKHLPRSNQSQSDFILYFFFFFHLDLFQYHDLDQSIS